MRSKILFLHHNFPGQFKRISKHLSEEGCEIKFLVETNYIGQHGNVECIVVNGAKNAKNCSLNGQIECGERFKIELKKLKQTGWYPDFIVSHTGWGCGLSTKDVYPLSFKVAYNEWWFSADAPEYRYHPENKWFRYSEHSLAIARQRNMSLAYELSESDAIVSPTKWQASQLPDIFRDKVIVIHEGIDTNYFQYNRKWRSDKIKRITYATRGLEPMRGFPEFIESLPKILIANKNVEVYIAGQDKIIYGGSKPKEGSFWMWAKNQLEPFIRKGRVKYVGHLNLQQYARLLKSSDVHTYLTRPFVASWSLIEAMSSGCCIVGNDVEPVREIVNNDATFWADMTKIETIQASISDALQLNKFEQSNVAKLQREKAIDLWSADKSILKWRQLLKQN